jgi:stress-induced morphogen
MRMKLEAAFSPVHLELENESHKHSEGLGSESHFKLFIVSAAFDGKLALERHRMVNDALKGADNNLPVHALSISAKTPAQFEKGAAVHSTPDCAHAR